MGKLPAPPAGFERSSALGSGTLFEVFLLRAGPEEAAPLVCKRLKAPVRAEPEARAALAREATVLAAASHPALPRVVRVGSDGEGPFLVETLAPGLSLASVREAWLARGLSAPPPTLCRHVASLALSLFAELGALEGPSGGRLGLAHGDLGPEHLLLGPSGELSLVDFGAARFRGMPASLVPPPGARGTLPFCPPEVARGEAEPGEAADVYALAATLVAFASPLPLCRSSHPAALLAEVGERGLDGAAVQACEAFSEVERAALGRALDPDPARRFARASELAAAFRG